MEFPIESMAGASVAYCTSMAITCAYLDRSAIAPCLRLGLSRFYPQWSKLLSPASPIWLGSFASCASSGAVIAMEIADGDGASWEFSCTISAPVLRHIEIALDAFVFRRHAMRFACAIAGSAQDTQNSGTVEVEFESRAQ